MPRRKKMQKLTAEQLVAAYGEGERNFIEVDLSGLDLSGITLTGISLYGARACETNFANCQLTHVQLKGADARRADFSGAWLNATDLIGTHFDGANFVRADLTGAALQGSTLRSANLSHTNLGGTNLTETNLEGARVTQAHLYHTILCNVDVSAFCAESTLNHGGPSHIDYRTVLKSYKHPRFREFIHDCGVPSMFAEFMIDCARASDFSAMVTLMQSTFISYGGPDESFAKKLYEALKARGIVTFFFPQTATVGARIGDEVFRRLQEHDRVLLVCSRKALERAGVINEIQETFDREARDGGATYLLPITLDDYVFTGWKLVQPELAERIGRRVVGDFRGARRSAAKFDAALDRVIHALKKKHPSPVA